MNLLDRSLIFFFCQVASCYLEKINIYQRKIPTPLVHRFLQVQKTPDFFFKTLHLSILTCTYRIFINFTLLPSLLLPSFSISSTLCYVTRIPILVIFRVYIIAVSRDLQKFSRRLSHSWANIERRKNSLKNFSYADNNEKISG